MGDLPCVIKDCQANVTFFWMQRNFHGSQDEKMNRLDELEWTMIPEQ